MEPEMICPHCKKEINAAAILAHHRMVAIPKERRVEIAKLAVQTRIKKYAEKKSKKDNSSTEK